MALQIRDHSFHLNERKVFLNSGEIHYFRIKRELWDKHLAAARDAGLTTVSTYVPWAWHESVEGVFDFDGSSLPERDLRGWLARCHELGLTCIVKPGPFILAETRGAGLPDWFLDRHREQVKMRNRSGQIIPSDGVGLFHPAYLGAVTAWYDQVMPFLAARELAAGGPIILMQICNEIGVFAWLCHQADYSENVRTRFISYLSKRFTHITAVNRLWGTAYEDFNEVELPPDGRLPYTSKGDRGRDYEWHCFWRGYYGEYLRKLMGLARDRGVQVPFYHNLPGWIYGCGYEFPVNITMYDDLFGAESEMLFGVDHIPEFLSHRNLHDDRIINDITAAVQENKPLFAAEFQCGSREYHVVTNPRELELFYKASIAHGLTGWNFYMFSQGRNPRHRGYSGDTFYWFTPLTAEGERTSLFPVVQRMSQIVKCTESIILESKRRAEICVLFYSPHYATELERPETGASELRFTASAIRRPAYFDGLLKALQILNIDYDMADLGRTEPAALAKYKQVWAFSTDEMNAPDQQTLVEYAQGGGQLVIFPYLPDRELNQTPCALLRDALGVRPSGIETIDSPLIDVYDLKDVKCANPQAIYDEASLKDAKVIARTIRGSACGFATSLGHGSVIHLGTWLGFDTERHKSVYEAMLKKSGARLRHVSVSNENLTVAERFTPDGKGLLFVGNYYNEEHEGKVIYAHPVTGESINLPLLGDTLTWPPLYAMLTPLCLEICEGIRVLHATSDLIGLTRKPANLELTLQGDRDLAGEIVFEGPQAALIQSATIRGKPVKLVREGNRVVLGYHHKHGESLRLKIALRPKPALPTLTNAAGLTFEFLDNGSVKSLHADPIRIGLKAASPFCQPGTNLYLRRKGAPIEFRPLLGPESNSRFQYADGAFIAEGSWGRLDYRCVLQLSRQHLSWRWSVEVQNKSNEPVELDLVYLQDAGLKPVNAGLLNEYYVSQYLERRILQHPTHGAVACCRQNMRESTGHPWFMLACGNTAVAGTTDGMQFYGRTYRETRVPEALRTDHPGGDYAGESSVFSLREAPFRLEPGQVHHTAFFGAYLPDHAEATSEADLDRLPGLMAEFSEPVPGRVHRPGVACQVSLFNTAPFLPVEDLTEDELTRFFGTERRHVERDKDRLLSFFYGPNHHVMLRAKEVLGDRPHAHIMQAQAGHVPHESILSTTCFAFGVFNSHLTQGNTNFNVLLSICTSQFNLSPESGQRIFVEVQGKRYLLGVPSAFEMGLNHCRWIYRHGDHCFQVRSWTSKDAPQVNLDFKVLQGSPVRLLVTHDFDPLNGWSIGPGKRADEFVAKPKSDSLIAGKFPHARFRIVINQAMAGWRVGSDELLYAEPKRQGGARFVLEVPASDAFGLSIVGEVISSVEPVRFPDPDLQWRSDSQAGQASWKKLSSNLALAGEQPDIAAIREALPWFGMNALTHFLTPYGLEQFGGAAWGTRDVSQGPMDLLLNLQQYEAARQVLCTIFSHQNPDGGWPQWWMFDRYANIRAHEAHGDIVYWCLIALGNHIKVTGDLKILDEVLPYYQDEGPRERTPLREHVDRLIRMIMASFIPGTTFVPFGGGDWNDSLQPVSKELAQRMISSWTVEMNYQAFAQWKWVYEQVGETAKAAELEQICSRIKAEFNQHLIKDGVVAGYGLLENDRSIHVLLHPSDTRTGIRYSLLPMNRGILSGLFTREQALHHQQLIEAHLRAPDGARLMDRPLRYRGGIQTLFQRAESSTFFGREIGLMYVHEHIRYAEALACTGQAEAFVKALRQTIPVGYRDIVPCADIRQANCYYSSSDVVFRNRYEADELYAQIKTGKLTLRGGWRIYSSGPGIYVGLVISRLLGLRLERDKLIIDPVLPRAMDGLSMSVELLGRPLTIEYAVKEASFSPKSVTLNGQTIPFALEPNQYRQGGAVLARRDFEARLLPGVNKVEVTI